jgi:hypothetical protein
VNMELSSNDVNQAKADPDSDRGNNQTFNASLADISPHCARY